MSIHYAVQIHVVKTELAAVSSAVGRDSSQHLRAGGLTSGCHVSILRTSLALRATPLPLCFLLLHVEHDCPLSQTTK